MNTAMVYCIGAQKSGTTWLHHYFKKHPSVHVPRTKEVHFWDSVREPHTPYYKDMAEQRLRALQDMPLHRKIRRRLAGTYGESLRTAESYRRMFKGEGDVAAYRDFIELGRQGQPVVADVTPGYALLTAETFREIREAHETSRFIFIMRDPVSRLWSAVRHYLKTKRSTDDPNKSLMKILDNPNSRTMKFNDYAMTIRNLDMSVPQDDVLYLFYETLFSDETVARLCRFLSIPVVPGDLDEIVNQGIAARSLEADLEAAARLRLRPVYDFVTDRFGDDVPEAWRR